MKKLFSIILLFISTQTIAQVELDFDNELKLTVFISKFEARKHKIDTCENDDMEYYCLIDNLPWFGSDLGMDLPKYQLDSIIFQSTNSNLSLDVSGMFNPTFSGTIDKRHFSISNSGDSYEINGWFSDGAGSYCARWLIRKDSQLRTLLSNEEGECFN